MRNHHLTVADIGTDKSLFYDLVREYLFNQSEYVSCLYVDEYIYDHFAEWGNFSFDGETMFFWGQNNMRVIIKRDPPEDKTSSKQKHILRFNQVNPDNIIQNIVIFSNKQPSYIEYIMLDNQLFNYCKNNNNNLIKSFDGSKIWLNYGRWGRVPLLKLPDHLEMIA